MSDISRGVRTALKVLERLDRTDKLHQAHSLALEHKYKEALELLENLNLSVGETSVNNLLGYLLKAICYAELDYKQSATNSINVILNMSRWSLNPFYQTSLSKVKEEARKIKEQYHL